MAATTAAETFTKVLQIKIVISSCEGFFSKFRRRRFIKFLGAIFTISLFFKENKATSLPEKKEDAIIRRKNRMPYVIISRNKYYQNGRSSSC